MDVELHYLGSIKFGCILFRGTFGTYSIRESSKAVTISGNVGIRVTLYSTENPFKLCKACLGAIA